MYLILNNRLERKQLSCYFINSRWQKHQEKVCFIWLTSSLTDATTPSCQLSHKPRSEQLPANSYHPPCWICVFVCVVSLAWWTSSCWYFWEWTRNRLPKVLKIGPHKCYLPEVAYSLNNLCGWSNSYTLTKMIFKYVHLTKFLCAEEYIYFWKLILNCFLF